MEEKNAYRQGDVIIIHGASIPAAAKDVGHKVLAKGEVTGHAHQITQGEALLYEKDGVLYLRVLSDNAILTHEEHGPITLPKDDYTVLIQREYKPRGWRNVAD